MLLHKATRLIFFVALIFLISLFSPINLFAQRTRLSDFDKAQLIKNILKIQIRAELNNSIPSDEIITINIFLDGIHPTLLPKIDKIKFNAISKKDVSELSKKGGSYYSIGNFRVYKTYTLIDFSSHYKSETEYYGSGFSLYYKCRKEYKKWTIKGRYSSKYVSECN